MNYHKLTPTFNQEQFVCSILQNSITIGMGMAGTGKTLFSILAAINQLKSGNCEQVLITRTLVGVGGDIGWFPGNYQEKSAPYFMFIHSYLKEILGKDYADYIKKEKILVLPLEILRGHTYDNCIIISEESQNTTPSQLKMLVGRLGKNSKLVIIGDTKQRDVETSDGLFFVSNILAGLSDCGIIKFGYEDVKRNPRVAHILKAFDDNGY